MSWSRSLLAAACGGALLLAAPGDGRAVTRVSGPVQIGPSVATGDPGNHRAALSTTITNQGALPDRLINVSCPGAGNAILLNGRVQPVDPGSTVRRNGLDLPGAQDGRATPVQARFALNDAASPMTPGTLVPCSLYFEHAGQRVVIFTVGVRETETNEP